MTFLEVIMGLGIVLGVFGMVALFYSFCALIDDRYYEYMYGATLATAVTAVVVLGFVAWIVSELTLSIAFTNEACIQEVLVLEKDGITYVTDSDDTLCDVNHPGAESRGYVLP